MTAELKSNVVIYHDHCADGMGACFAAWSFLEHHAIYVGAVNEDKTPPQMDTFRMRTVYIVDFCYPAAVIREIAKVALKIVVLDHHESAIKEIMNAGTFPSNVDFRFDKNKSGAGITWDYFFPDTKRPLLIDYIEDRDLWRWKLHKSAEMNAYISLHAMNLESYKALSLNLEHGDFKTLAGLGAILLKYQDKMTGKICGLAFPKTLWSESTRTTYRVMIVNTCSLISEASNELLRRDPDLDFVIGWFDKNYECRIWSLRAKDKFDCQALAVKFGGGGHKNAAGFTTGTSFYLDKLP